MLSVKETKLKQQRLQDDPRKDVQDYLQNFSAIAGLGSAYDKSNKL